MKNFNDVISGVDEVINSAKQGNFDEVLSKTKDYAERATKRSAERLEISRKKIELLDSKTKLSRAYEKYGRLLYSAKSGEEVSEEEIASCEANIELQKMRADMLDGEIDELRAVFTDAVPSKRETVKPEKEQVKADVETVIVEPSDE